VVVEVKPLLANLSVPLIFHYRLVDICENRKHLVILSYSQTEGLAVDLRHFLRVSYLKSCFIVTYIARVVGDVSSR